MKPTLLLGRPAVAVLGRPRPAGTTARRSAASVRDLIICACSTFSRRSIPSPAGSERPYDPRPYDSRYARDVDRRGGPPRYDDYPPPRRDYDRGGYGGGGRYDDRGGYGGGGGSRYDDRRYDDRRY